MKRMSDSLKTSFLDDIDGIGKVKKMRVINFFGSVQNLKRANRDELTQIKGLNSKNIKAILDKINGQIYTIPNIITFVRIILIPIILYLLFSDNSNVVLIAGLLFIVSSISDYFDGYLARTLNQSSKLGTLLDPIADKLLIAAVIIVLIDTRVIADVHVIPAIIILLREIAISGLREFLAKLNTDMPVSKLAKYKTTFQMVSLSILIISLGFELNDFLWNFGLVTLWLAAIITLLSGYNYVAKGLKHI